MGKTDARSLQVTCNGSMNVSIKSICVVEAWGVDKRNASTVQLEIKANVDIISAWFKTFSDDQVGSACQVYELRIHDSIKISV